jgi:hydrogenase maturation factor
MKGVPQEVKSITEEVKRAAVEFKKITKNK